MTPDSSLLKQKIAMVSVVSVQWLVAAALPALVVGYLTMPPAFESAFFLALAVYCFWTGYRAWKRGWKTRFILRLAIPIGLFAISTCMVSLAKFFLPNARF
jgi:hypothetical protein